ncbi:hypothetical protein FACS1894186_0710 [Alphaproteobacteria bacterium]|nr:hypothetical protein FACS1894186_0710 [Alphaproteobacteria bacterium]
MNELRSQAKQIFDDFNKIFHNEWSLLDVICEYNVQVAQLGAALTHNSLCNADAGLIQEPNRKIINLEDEFADGTIFSKG